MALYQIALNCQGLCQLNHGFLLVKDIYDCYVQDKEGCERDCEVVNRGTDVEKG